MVLMIAFSGHVMAQKTVAGSVTAEDDGTPVPGVNVIVKGTSAGTVTDIDGKYQIGVPEDDGILVFSFIGLATEEVTIGNQSIIDMVMTADIRQLTEVVVTALGVTREKATLGYATQQVDSDELTRAKESNFVNSLSGKVAGLQVKQNNNFGGSSNVVIRGNSSISGSNQALFVVDGVPMDNRTGNDTYQRAGRYGYDYGNAASDINPEDIESMNVLKGAAATALYGSRAANGAIVITTKKGKSRKGIGVNVSTGYTATTIDKSTFIDHQRSYGAGYSNYYYGTDGGPFDNFEDVNGDGTPDNVVPTYEDGSYGQKFDPTLDVYHWDSFIPESPNYMQAYPWMAAENMPVTFFETGHTFNNSVSIDGGDDKSTFRLGYTNYQTTGILPNSDIKKNTFSFTGTHKVGRKFNATINANYIRQRATGRNSTGYGDNLMSEFRQWWQTNVDLKAQEDIYNETGRNVTWNMYDAAAGDHRPIFWDNPYWTRHKNYQNDGRNRLYGNINLDYEVIDGLNLVGRVTLDSYSELREQRRAVGSVAQEFGISKADEQSGYQREDRRVSEINYDLMATYTKDISSNFSIYALVGMNARRQDFESVIQSTLGGLAIPELYAISNSVLTPPFPDETLTEKEVFGVFGNVSLGFMNMLYLDLSARQDKSSALPIENNSYFYPAASLSWIFSEMVDVSWLDLGKLRVNYATVGSDTGPLNTKDTYVRNDNFGTAILSSVHSTKNNPILKPEYSTSYEVGGEFAFFRNRLSVDAAFYNTDTYDQIIRVEVSRASGNRYQYVNGGQITNKGVELTIGGDILRMSNGLTWNAQLNWSRNRSEVVKLYTNPTTGKEIKNIVLQSPQGGISMNATVGQPFGILKGTGYTYHENGEKLVNSGGYYVATADQIIGDPNPEWMGGLMNTLSYKGVTLSFLFDWSQGGDIYSLDMHYGQGTGLPANTVGLNEQGNEWRLPKDEGGGILNPGVKEDGTANDVYARGDYYGGAFYWGNSARNPGEMTVYDASYVKLREAAITYNFPKGLLGNAFQNVALSVTGRNLWILSKNLPYADPESGLGAGNAQGYVSGSYPTPRQVGFKLDLQF
jgi:TonB-linked SusC/RagA family outer membrane protein